MLFNPELLNTCTLGVVRPPEEAGPSEIWDTQPATKPVTTHVHTNPDFRKEVVSDFLVVFFFFFTDLGLPPVLLATCFTSLCLPSCQSARR